MITDRAEALELVEEFVRWLGKAAALREVFPEYVLVDSKDYATATREIDARRANVTEIAEELNPGAARRLQVCLDDDDDLEGAAIACQRLYLILEPEGHVDC
jgi:hypothetical protein